MSSVLDAEHWLDIRRPCGL